VVLSRLGRKGKAADVSGLYRVRRDSRRFGEGTKSGEVIRLSQPVAVLKPAG